MSGATPTPPTSSCTARIAPLRAASFDSSSQTHPELYDTHLRMYEYPPLYVRSRPIPSIIGQDDALRPSQHRRWPARHTRTHVQRLFECLHVGPMARTVAGWQGTPTPIGQTTNTLRSLLSDFFCIVVLNLPRGTVLFCSFPWDIIQARAHSHTSVHSLLFYFVHGVVPHIVTSIINVLVSI